MTEEKTSKPSFVFKDKKGKEYYRANLYPNDLPAYHKSLMYFHIFYLFAIPSLGVFLNSYYFESTGWFRFSAWLFLTMYVGMVINNYQLPVNKKKALIQVMLVPFELTLIFILFGTGIAVELIEWSMVEIFGFMFGLIVGTIGRRADITTAHRVGSFLIALVFTLIILFGFYDFVSYSFNNNLDLFRYLMILPYATAIYNFSRMFVSPSGNPEDGNNGPEMGTAPLMDKLTPLVGIFVLIWFFLPSVGKALGE